MSKKQQRKTASPAAPQRRWWLWAVAAAAVVLVVSGLTVLLTTNNSQPGSGAPKVVVDRPEIDEGYQKLDVPVRTAFKIRNEGAAALQILGEPEVKLVEGC